MAIRLHRVFPAALLLAALSIAASAGTTISPRLASTAATGLGSVHRSGQTRRPFLTQYCATTGPLAFVGGGQNNVSGGQAAGIIAGTSNQACGQNDAIGAGSQNAIFPNGGPDYESFIGGGSNNEVYSNGLGGTYGSIIGAGLSNSVTAWYAGIGAGARNVIGPAGAASSIGAGQSNTIGGEASFIGAGGVNTTSGADAFIGAGSYSAAAVSAGVGAGHHNVATGQNSFVGSGEDNEAAAPGAFVGAGELDVAGGLDSFVGSGDGNALSVPAGFIGAGTGNAIRATRAGGSNGGAYAVIGGGYQNLVNPIAANGAQNAVIAGGDGNVVTGTSAAVGGGYKNSAGGTEAVVPGGYENVANGTGSFAAGVKAAALHNGTFVWSDGSSTKSLNSSAPYQFLARASGGFFLYSSAAARTGVKLAPGSGAWASLSDRNEKSGVVPLDDAAILERVAALPVGEWSYRSERGVRHVGPMAQDFYAAFHVGADDRHITSIDEDGVALAAIKALDAQQASLQSEHASLQKDKAALLREVTLARNDDASLRARLDALDAKVVALWDHVRPGVATSAVALRPDKSAR